MNKNDKLEFERLVFDDYCYTYKRIQHNTDNARDMLKQKEAIDIFLGFLINDIEYMKGDEE